jgi:DNA-binding FadR family transcriptional regulator
MTIAERIYSASTSEDVTHARLAEKLARQIEDDIVFNNVSAGGGMGSLRELSQRYSAGRAAAREAVALLERRGLGRLRPGPCGGFIVTEPERKAIGAELANYFRRFGVTLAQLNDACETLDLMIADFAPAHGSGNQALETLEEGGGLQWHLRLRANMAALSGEPVIELFAHCLNELVIDFAPDEMSAVVPDCAAMRKALRAGDSRSAAAVAAELNAKFNRHLREQDGSPQWPVFENARLTDDRTLSTFVARKLAAEICRVGVAGQRLGSEWDLCERYSVSRTTLRQAIRQLQDSGLVEGRRGRGNGLVIRDARGAGSVRLAVTYLISRKMDPMAAGTLLFQLNRFVPALAASRANDAQREALRALLDRVQQDPIDRCDLLHLVQYVSEVADSPIIDLFSRCVAAYEARFHPLLIERLPARVQAEYFTLLRGLLEELEGADAKHLARAKRQSANVMLEMSRSRPL